jgi:hypothetical protein
MILGEYLGEIELLMNTLKGRNSKPEVFSNWSWRHEQVY